VEPPGDVRRITAPEASPVTRCPCGGGWWRGGSVVGGGGAEVWCWWHGGSAAAGRSGREVVEPPPVPMLGAGTRGRRGHPRQWESVSRRHHR